jgi:tetratricopeptide (TPR) repeat protein
LGEYESAVEDCDHAIEHIPALTIAYRTRGKALSALGQHRGALRNYDTAIRLEPSNSELFVERALQWQCLNEWKNSISDLEAALRLDVKNTRAHIGLARIKATCTLENLRDADDALRCARRACELTDWKNATALEVLSQAHAESGEFDDAKMRLAQAIKLTPDDRVEQRREMMELYTRRKPFREARLIGEDDKEH